MALSESVETSLKDAEVALRNALSFSARQERPYVSVMISGMISNIDKLISFDKFADQIENIANGDENFPGGLFK
jgi:hypothetical protein